MALTRALIVNRDAVDPTPIPVAFNPPEYQLQRTNQFAEVGIPGLGSSLLQFVRGSAETLTIELFFDTTDSGQDVRTLTRPLVDLTGLDRETHAPPRLLFMWGSLAFPCVLESVSQRFIRFDAAGKPLRAELSVTLKSYDALQSLLAANPLRSADRARQHVVVAGESLQGIAAEVYDDPRKWRPVAQANGIDNPLRLPVGRALVIPALE